jgi:hypothetical protein
MSEVPSLHLRNVVRSRSEVVGQLVSPGDAVLVERGVPRWLVMQCPCGCGAEIPINLDSRAGPAWRLYNHPKRGITLFPSVWRDTDCESHFIIRRDHIILFGHERDNRRGFMDDEEIKSLAALAASHLPEASYVSYVVVADALGAIPWDVLDSLHYLVRKKQAIEGTDDARGTFRRA